MLYIRGAESCEIKLYYYNTFTYYIIVENCDRDVATIVCQRPCLLSRIYFTFFHLIQQLVEN